MKMHNNHPVSRVKLDRAQRRGLKHFSGKDVNIMSIPQDEVFPLLAKIGVYLCTDTRCSHLG